MQWPSRASQCEPDSVVSPRASEMRKSFAPPPPFYAAVRGRRRRQGKGQEAQHPCAEAGGGVPRAQSTEDLATGFIIINQMHFPEMIPASQLAFSCLVSQPLAKDCELPFLEPAPPNGHRAHVCGSSRPVCWKALISGKARGYFTGP